MKKTRELLQIVGTELNQCAGGNDNDFIDSNRKDALAYYLGQADGKEVEGRSSVVSTDVADAIEWIMPQIMEQLTKNNEVVSFDPTGPGDEDQAELETNVVYDIFMKDNCGFQILHTCVKDALMQKNGIMKIFYEADTVSKTTAYTGLSEMGYQVALQDPQAELIEETMRLDDMGMPTYDIRIRTSYEDPRIRVMSVPPEEFRISRQHNNQDPSKARFCAHVCLKTASELIEQGMSREEVDSIPRYYTYDDDRDYRFYMQGETVYPNREVSDDKSQDLIEVSECYLWLDINDDGVAEFVKIETAGGDNPTHLISVEEMDPEDHPFVAVLAIMMSHKFFGLSIYDRLRQLQDQKTTLWRNIFDNLYLQNNQRTAVVEGQVNLDDMFISRPGGIVRQRQPGMIEPLVTPSIGQDAYQMMEYLDQVRAGRVGVTPEGQIQVDNIGDRVGSEGVERLMTAKEAVVGLMIRVMAEGVKDAMLRVRHLARKHMDSVYDFKFREDWKQYAPTTWSDRSRMTVNVGTGSGSNQANMMALNQIIQGQMALSQNPSSMLVSDQQMYSAWRAFANASGVQGGSSFFLDPKSEQGQAASKQQMDQQMEEKQKEMAQLESMLSMQNKLSDAEVANAQAAMENVNLKGDIELMKRNLEEQKTIIDDTHKQKELEFDYKKLYEELQYKYTELAAKREIEADKAAAQAAKPAPNGAS